MTHTKQMRLEKRGGAVEAVARPRCRNVARPLVTDKHIAQFNQRERLGSQNAAPLQFGKKVVEVHYYIQVGRCYLIFLIFTMLPLACESFGSFTTVMYNSSSSSPKATLVVPSPAAISKTWRSLPSGDIFKILPPNHWAT